MNSASTAKLQFFASVALAGALATASIGCASRDTDSEESKDALDGTLGVPGLPVVEDIWPADADTLSAQVSGGFQPLPPKGSECDRNYRKFQLKVSSRKLVWERCDTNPALPEGEPTVGGLPGLPGPDGVPFRIVRGQAVLTASQVQNVRGAVNALELQSTKICGADAPFYTFDIASGSDTKTYADGFYSCHAEKGVTYVANIYSVFNAIERALAPASAE